MDDDNLVAIIEDDSMDIEDNLLYAVREGVRGLNSPAKRKTNMMNTRSREATQDVDENPESLSINF